MTDTGPPWEHLVDLLERQFEQEQRIVALEQFIAEMVAETKKARHEVKNPRRS